VALATVAKLRRPDGKPVCPRCGGLERSFLKTRRIWKCRKQFSVKIGTLFEDSPIGLASSHKRQVRRDASLRLDRLCTSAV
jgi:hypothetical protein